MDITNTIFNLISENLGVEKENISLDSHFYKDLNAEKLEVADLISKTVQLYQLEISEEDYNHIKTVSDLVDLINSHSHEL